MRAHDRPQTAQQSPASFVLLSQCQPNGTVLEKRWDRHKTFLEKFDAISRSQLQKGCTNEKGHL
jgi:hypothetical protein